MPKEVVSKDKAVVLGVVFVVLALSIEFLDELVDGVSGAAWPLIRSDVPLSYLQIGWLLTLPALIANLIEPLFALLTDTGRRRILIVCGGFAYVAALALIAASHHFWVLMAGMLLYFPAAGAFVSLMQAAWMDADPQRREHNMARWTLAGSVGNVAGPLMIGLAAQLRWGWRPVYGLLAGLLLGLALLVWHKRSVLDVEVLADTPSDHENLEQDEPPAISFKQAAGQAYQALKRGEVRRSLWMLECGNLMLDIFRGFVALYFVDVVGADESKAALAVALFTGVGLLGDALLIPLLARVSGIRYLFLSAWLTALLFLAFLLVPSVNLKLVLLAVLGLLNAGWYAILQAQLYEQLPRRSGTALVLGNVAGLLGGIFPLALGLVEQQFGLTAALWTLMIGPLSLIGGLRRQRQTQ